MKNKIILSVAVNIVLIIFIMYSFLKPDFFLNIRESFKKKFGTNVCTICLEIKKTIEKKGFKDTTELIDCIRNYVYENSEHNESSDYYKAMAINLERRFDVLRDMHLYNTEKKQIPHLACTGRSWAMIEILNTFGIESRLINIYFSEKHPNTFTSHTFLEVLNPSTNHWEIQDPDGNIYYSDSISEKRLSSIDIMTTADNTHIKAHKSKDDSSPSYSWVNFYQAFKAIKIGYLGKNRKKDILLVDDDYFDLNKKSKVWASNSEKRFLEQFDLNKIHLIVF